MKGFINTKALWGMLLLLTLFLGCEKDDICLGGTPATPALMLSFYDVNNPEVKKPPTNLRIRPIGMDTLIAASGDVKLDLRTDQEFTEFDFISNYGNTETENTDRIQIHYDRNDIYINRACGYRAEFILDANAIRLAPAAEAWIQDFKLIEPTIKDETTTHLGLLH
jgi:hypothetical protein